MIDPAFLQRLEQFRLALKRLATSTRSGDLSGKRSGESAEFRKHRPYSAGDDLRTVDWNAYARLEELFVKETAREQAPVIAVLIDGSKSMASGGKFDFAIRVAQAFSYVALCNNAQLLVAGRSYHGVARATEALSHLQSITPSGDPFARTLKSFAADRPRGQVALMLSDFWDSGVVEQIPRLRALAGDLAAIQVLSPEELSPTVSGKVRLVDAESGEASVLYVGDEERTQYAALLRQHLEALDRICRDSEVRLARLTSDMDLAAAFLVTVRNAGLLQ